MPVSWIYSTSSTGQEIEGSVEVIVVPLLDVDFSGSRGGSVPITAIHKTQSERLLASKHQTPDDASINWRNSANCRRSASGSVCLPNLDSNEQWNVLMGALVTKGILLSDCGLCIRNLPLPEGGR